MEGVQERRRRADLAAVDPAMDRIWRGRGGLGGRREEGCRRGREEGRGEATRGGEDEGESEETTMICVGGERRSIFASRFASNAKCLSVSDVCWTGYLARTGPSARQKSFCLALLASV